MLTLSWRIVEAGSVVLEQPPPWGFDVCVEQDWDAGGVGPVENRLGDSWEGVGHSSLGQIQDLVVHMVGSPGVPLDLDVPLGHMEVGAQIVQGVAHRDLVGY